MCKKVITSRTNEPTYNSSFFIQAGQQAFAVLSGRQFKAQHHLYILICCFFLCLAVVKNSLLLFRWWSSCLFTKINIPIYSNFNSKLYNDLTMVMATKTPITKANENTACIFSLDCSLIQPG